MKKSMLIAVICTVIVTLLLVVGTAFLINWIQNSGDWQDNLKGSVTFKGEIVEIVNQDEGKILTIVDENTGVSREIWVYEDTALEGTLWGSTLEELLNKQIAGACVSVDAYDAMDNIVDGHKLYAAKTITVTE